MLCHVTRPDSVVMEVEVDAKANGEDCLNKVSTIIIIIKKKYYDDPSETRSQSDRALFALLYETSNVLNLMHLYTLFESGAGVL